MIALSLSEQIAHHAARRGQSLALADGESRLTYQALRQEINRLNATFNLSGDVPALAMDNSVAWAVLDLALLEQKIPCVPLPLFFSRAQTIHAMKDAGVTCVLTDRADFYSDLIKEANFDLIQTTEFKLCGKHLTLIKIANQSIRQLPKDTIKITYTSGTTGTPKGVCLSEPAISNVAYALLERTEASASDVHLSLLPLSTLLENLAGLYVPLIAGGVCVLPSLSETGLLGSSGLDVGKMVACLAKYQASSTITTPELLLGLVSVLGAGNITLPALRFVAVGGASVSPALLSRAVQLGVPVFEGYGLSECASVVAVNSPKSSKVGSVGQPLPHIQLSFAADGEVIVQGNCMLGYVGGETQPIQAWRTGDIGFLDPAGFLHITGRKKNIFITSFGRNVSPEWVERELMVMPAIAQAVVFGEAKPFNVAVVVTRNSFDLKAVNAAIQAVNAQLPDYARVSQFILADASFTPSNGLLTANGRLKRDAIYFAYQERIQKLYEEVKDVVL